MIKGLPMVAALKCFRSVESFPGHVEIAPDDAIFSHSGDEK